MEMHVMSNIKIHIHCSASIHIRRTVADISDNDECDLSHACGVFLNEDLPVQNIIGTGV